MKLLAKREYLTLLVLGLVFVGFLYPALRHSRREVRDGWRRTEVRDMKRGLEHYFNEHQAYPNSFDGIHQYVPVEEEDGRVIGWYIRAELENTPLTATDFDYEHNIFYRTGMTDGRAFYDVCGGVNRCGFEGVLEN